MNQKMVSVILIVLMTMSFGIGAQAQDDTEIYVLGVAQPFTGSLGTFGEDFARGIELAVMQMNAELEAAGSAIRFEIASADTEQTPEGAARAVQTIVQTTGAQVIIGPLTTSEVLGAKQFADENGVVLIAPASSGTAASIPDDNIFRVINPPDVFSAKAYAKLAHDRNYKNVVILHIDDPFGNGMVAGFTSNFQAAGGGEVVSFGYAPSPADLSSEAAAISAAIAGLGDDTAFFCICFLGDGQLFLQVAQVDPILSAVEWMGAENMATDALLQDEGHAQLLANAKFVSVSSASTSTPLTPMFVNDFTEAYDKPPGPYTNSAFDAANIGMLSMLAAGNDGNAVKSMLPFISSHYIGTTVQAFLDENGDQAIALYGIYQVNAEGSAFEEIAEYNGSNDALTYSN